MNLDLARWQFAITTVYRFLGAPLAIKGLLAFFLESTFLGLWIFGWDRLPKRVHLACFWLASIGTFDPASLACVGGSSALGRTEWGKL